MLISYSRYAFSLRRLWSSPRVVGEAVELLAERHRHGVLQLGAADLQHVVELHGLVEERPAQQVELVEQRLQVEAPARP